MLRRAEDVRLTFEALPHRQGWLVLQVGPERFRLKRIDQGEFRHILQGSAETPRRLAKIGKPAMWLFRESYFWDEEGLTPAEVQREFGRGLPALSGSGQKPL